MFEYSICNQADEEIFNKQCTALEKNVPNIMKERTLKDVDGSLIQKYKTGEDLIVVHNSYYENEVYVKSTIELRQFFKESVK